MTQLSVVRANDSPPRRRGCVWEHDVELLTMRAIARLLEGVPEPGRSAVVDLLMQPLIERDVTALLTVTRLIGVLDPEPAARVRRWVYDRFGQSAGPESPNPAEEPWR